MNKLKLLLTTVLLAVIISGCKYDIGANSVYNERIFVDEETGINYIYIITAHGVTMHPRYNVDGSLYVSK